MTGAINAVSVDLLPADLIRHRGFSRAFQSGHLTIGLIMPLEGYHNSPAPTLRDHVAMARKADDLGFTSLWLRDVPFYDPSFGDVGQVLDPMVYLGFLAAQTRQIALGTTGMVVPLREPVTLAKQAASVDQLTGGRFILGLSTGDRPTEYPAFGASFENRADRFRDAVKLINVLHSQSFPSYDSVFYGNLNGQLDLVPKPAALRLPTLVVGRAGQDLDWIARHADGWLWHRSDFAKLPEVIARWRAACAGQAFKPYGYATFFDLAERADTPMQIAGNVLRTGRDAFVTLLERQRNEGVNHIALNLKPLRRPASDMLDELAEFVLPLFPTLGSQNA